MQRLLKISLDQILMSLTPILSWFVLSLLVDKNLISVFTITYPLQFVYSIIRSPFAVGANISKIRDKNKNAAMTGFLIGAILSIACYGFVIINIDSYISFMNMDPTIYRTFSIYAVMIFMLQTIFSFIIDQLYYRNRNSLANFYSIAFNFLNFTTLIGAALLTKNQLTIVSVSIVIMTLFTCYVVIKNFHKFHPSLNLFNCFKYDSVSLFTSIFGFLTYFFGLSNIIDFGPEYALAITFVSLITDTQWDTLESVTIRAKIDVSQHKFNYKKSLRESYVLVGLLYISTILMFCILSGFYALDLRITLTFLGLELIDMIFCPAYYLRTVFLQLNWSASKTTANRIVTRIGRLSCSFLPTPFCNTIGSLSSTVYQIITTRIFLSRHFIIDKNGRIIRRRTPQRTNATEAYHDLPID